MEAILRQGIGDINARQVALQAVPGHAGRGVWVDLSAGFQRRVVGRIRHEPVHPRRAEEKTVQTSEPKPFQCRSLRSIKLRVFGLDRGVSSQKLSEHARKASEEKRISDAASVQRLRTEPR